MGEQDVADQRGAFACREGPVTRVVAGPSFVWAQGARAPASRRRRVPLGCPFDHVSGAASGPSGSSGDATCRVRQAIAPRHLARWRGAFVTSRNAAFRQRPRSFGTKRRAPSMSEAPLRDAKAPLARRASPRVEPGRSSSHGLRPSLEQGGDPRCRPPCVVVISFDGTRRLPSWRFRRASKAVCLEPCRRGCGSGVMARRCGNLFWVTSPDLPIRVSSVRRVWIGAHGFLYKTDAVGLCRRVGRS